MRTIKKEEIKNLIGIAGYMQNYLLNLNLIMQSI